MSIADIIILIVLAGICIGFVAGALDVAGQERRQERARAIDREYQMRGYEETEEVDS